MAEAPAEEETLTPDDAVDVLEELLPAQNKSYELGLKFKLPQSEVESIHSTYSKPRNCLLQILIEFANQAEPRPTWRVIVEALRSRAVNLPALARKVEAAHFPDPTSTCDVVPDTQSAASKAAIYAEVKLKSSSQLNPITASGPVDAVVEEIEGFHERFNSVKELTIRGLEKCFVTVMAVVFILTNIRSVQEHRVFLKENHKALRQCEDHLELFGSLNFYWNYLAYDLLDHLIKELAKKHKFFQTVAAEMTVYKKDLQDFRRRTKLELFCKAEPHTLEDPPAGFRKLVVKFDWPETATLEDVENFRRQYACCYDLKTCAMILNSIGTGSFAVTFFIPASVVGMMRKKRALSVFKEFCVVKLEIHASTEVCVYQTFPRPIAPYSTVDISAVPDSTAAVKREPAEKSAADEDDYPFTEEPDGDFFCPVTMGLLLQPHLTSCCGNHLSQEAAARVQGGEGACPLCKKQSWSTVLNKHFQREVNSLHVFCHHEDRGCGWQGELVALHLHIQSCPMKEGPLMTELMKLPAYSDGADGVGFDTTGAEPVGFDTTGAEQVGFDTTGAEPVENSSQVKGKKNRRTYLRIPKWMTRMGFLTKGKDQTPLEQTPPEQEPTQQKPQKKPPEDPVYLALFDYQPKKSDELGFQRREKLEITNQDRERWLARSLDTMKEGYIHRNYVTKYNGIDAEDWFFGSISRVEAEKLLRTHSARGTFLIRESESSPGNYALSISDGYGESIRHYRIRRMDEGGFWITRRASFATLQDLVDYYCNYADGLCTNLVTPCPTHKPFITRYMFEIPREFITFTRQLSLSPFWEEFEGRLNGEIPVAIKSFKPGTTQLQFLLQEASVIKKLCHPKLVQLYGVCTLDEPFLMITESMQRGSLLDYLQGKGRTMQFPQLIDMAAQVAAGMAFLELHTYIHGDLTACNIMVGENNICKVANFGMARLIDEDAPDEMRFRIKWIAPEAALYNRFSTKSDVWSFGVLLTELVTYGRIPYPGMTNAEVLQQLERGYRMPCPSNTPNTLYQLMLATWKTNPMDRPTFEFLQSALEDFFALERQYFQTSNTML